MQNIRKKHEQQTFRHIYDIIIMRRLIIGSEENKEFIISLLLQTFVARIRVVHHSTVFTPLVLIRTGLNPLRIPSNVTAGEYIAVSPNLIAS